MPASEQTISGLADEISMASIIPTIARALLGLVEDRGYSPERICQGLGVRYEDLLSHQVRLSHRQVRALILRAQQVLDEPALGLLAGMRQTPVSWGVPGLAMLTCETLGDAMNHVLTHQYEAGTMVQHHVSMYDNMVMLQLMSLRYDREIENYLIDESMAGAVAVARYLLGADFKPLRIDLAQPQPMHHILYRDYFSCPIRFEAGSNMMVIDARWMEVRLPGYDRIASQVLRRQLDSLLLPLPDRHQLIETVSNHIRYTNAKGVDQLAVASLINVSSRSLRRQLEQQGTSFRHLRNSTRYQRACELLEKTNHSLWRIAEQLGYTDVRSFRRAFKRWSGMLPSDYRERLREGA